MDAELGLIWPTRGLAVDVRYQSRCQRAMLILFTIPGGGGGGGGGYGGN
jgi:hypothetical protein